MRVLQLPHVCAHVVDGRPVVDIDDDAELFNFVEDELIERFDLEYEYLHPLKDSGQVRLVYGPTTSIDAIFDALRSIDPAELEHLFRLNNPTSGGAR